MNGRSRLLCKKLSALSLMGLLAACGSDAAPNTPPAALVLPAQPQAGNPAAGVRPPTGVAGAPPITAPTAPVVPASDATWCGVKQTLDARCIACHDGQKTAGAPMALKTYADLQAPAVTDATKKVFQMVGVRVHDKVKPMPPQDKLTADQLADIDGWVAAGAPAGVDPTCAANVVVPVATDRSWPTNCDETYKVLAADPSQPNTVAAGTEDHPQIAIQAPWGNEEVQAIGWRSIVDNKKVLHHWILYGPQREFLFGWAPGKDINEPLPDDVGLYLPAGTMTMDVHYNNSQGTQMESDASGVEICVLKKANFRPKTATTASGLTAFTINVPPHAVDQDATGSCTHTGEPVRLLSVSPHAHKTAHHMKFTVEKANGEVIVMHDQEFNFEEQTTYALKPPVVIESGDSITTTCTYTNPTDQTITFGENTGDEMCFNFAIYEPMGGLSCGGFGGFPGQ